MHSRFQSDGVPPLSILNNIKDDLQRSSEKWAIDEWRSIRHELDEQIEKAKDLAWDACFRTATRTGLFVAYGGASDSGEPPSRLVARAKHVEVGEHFTATHRQSPRFTLSFRDVEDLLAERGRGPENRRRHPNKWGRRCHACPLKNSYLFGLAATVSELDGPRRNRSPYGFSFDLVVTASDQRPDAVAAAAVTMRVRAFAPHYIHYWVRFQHRKRIGADRWQSGRRGHTDRANEDRSKNVTHLVTPFGPIDPWP
jgi:hypothetical protein